jgi:hypothetical protein
MKRYLILMAALIGLLIGCDEAAPAQVDLLSVTDGTSERSYRVEELKSLGADQATFGEITYIGVPLGILLKDAGHDPVTLSAVKATAADGFSANYDPNLVNRPDTLVAYARVAGPLAEDEGAFRMVLPGQEGKLNPRHLVALRIYP